MARAHQYNNLVALQRALFIHQVIGGESATRPYTVEGNEPTLTTIYQDLKRSEIECETEDGVLRVNVLEGVDEEFRALIESYGENVRISSVQTKEQ